ncbi:MAG TPA: carbohydrate ABC transporter permease [Gaiellaceae bacterium]
MDAVLRGFREKGMSYLIVGPFAIVLAFPFYVMLITAFKQQRDFYDLSHTPYWFHKGPTLANARFLFNETPYTQWLQNTAIIGIAVVLITLLLAVPAGYALARLSGGVGQSLGVGIFLTYLVPPTLLFLPLFSVITQLDRQTSRFLHFHLRGSIWSLVLVYPSFTVPFATWLLMGFFKTIPRELEDAARIDGASRLGTLIRVVFPISIPGILTVVIFSFSLVVNEFVYAFTFISSSAHRTLSTGVYTDLIRGDLPQWGAIMVASLIPSIPLALLYNTFLDRFIAGFTGGAFR